MHAALKQIVMALVPRPVLAPLLRKRFLACREFRNLHWGVFDSFAAANQWAAAHDQRPRFTLDHRQWLEERTRLFSHDYPILFWLSLILQSKPAVLADLGGSVGVSYLAFRKVLPLDPAMKWLVCELPETVAVGREIAAEHQASALAFTSELSDLDGAEVLLTAGTIQYIETPLYASLRTLRAPPRHVLVNRLPLTQRHPAFVTLQHSGQTMTPMRIGNRDEFVEGMRMAGYRQIDRWLCLENWVEIPLHPDHGVQHFHGFYFRHEGVQ